MRITGTGIGEMVPELDPPGPFTLSGLFRSLQQGQSVTSQDLLMAVDACEELLQEVDITPFLLALCGHARSLPHAPPSPGPLSPGPFSSSIEEGPEPRERAVLASESRLGLSWNNVEGGTQSPNKLGPFNPREWPSKVAPNYLSERQ